MQAEGQPEKSPATSASGASPLGEATGGEVKTSRRAEVSIMEHYAKRLKPRLAEPEPKAAATDEGGLKPPPRRAHLHDGREAAGCEGYPPSEPEASVGGRAPAADGRGGGRESPPKARRSLRRRGASACRAWFRHHPHITLRDHALHYFSYYQPRLCAEATVVARVA